METPHQCLHCSSNNKSITSSPYLRNLSYLFPISQKPIWVGEATKTAADIYHTIQNFGERKFWWNSSRQKLANNILANAQNQVEITKHSLVTHEITCCRDITCYITCNVSWSPAWSTCLVWRQWLYARI